MNVDRACPVRLCGMLFILCLIGLVHSQRAIADTYAFKKGNAHQRIRISPNYVYDRATAQYYVDNSKGPYSNAQIEYSASSIPIDLKKYFPIDDIDSLPSSFSQNTSNIPISEFNALRDIYDSTNGPSWIWSPHHFESTHWNFTGPHNPCTERWQGITCICQNITSDTAATTNNNHTCNINRIILESYNLVGSIPASISNFTQLTWLQMCKNTLVSSIPYSIADMTALRILDFSYNNLTGTIPHMIDTLVNMEHLLLNSNRFNGTIPESYGNFSLLQQFTVSENYVTGTIPVFLTTLPRLVQIDLYGNAMHGPIPASIGNLTNLRLLNIFNNLEIHI